MTEMKSNPLDPTAMKAWNMGREAGKKEAMEMFYNYLTRKMDKLTDVDGVGFKTAKKVQEHFLGDMEI